MFEAAYKRELSKLTDDIVLIHSYENEIIRQYEQPGRYYHNLSHLDHIYSNLLPVLNNIADPAIIIFSIAYHDFIYKVSEKDNEEKSAEIAEERLKNIRLSDARIEKSQQQILATKHHLQSADHDTNYFTDADLSILGSEPAAYQLYAANVRREYQSYPDSIYIPGRRRVLHHFLQMNRIFKTKYFQDIFEQQARQNISWELSLLLH